MTPLGSTVGSECRVGDVRAATAVGGPGVLSGVPGAGLGPSQWSVPVLGRAGPTLGPLPLRAGLPQRRAPFPGRPSSRSDDPVHARARDGSLGRG